MLGETTLSEASTALAGDGSKIAEPVTVIAAMQIDAAAKRFDRTTAASMRWGDTSSLLERICNTPVVVVVVVAGVERYENEGIATVRRLLNGTKAAVAANDVRRIVTIQDGDRCFMIDGFVHSE